MVDRQFVSPPDKQQVAAQKKAYAKLEQLATKLLATPGAAKPYVHELMLGHIASKRGDLAGTRAHMQKAVAMAPRDRRVASQAKASVAIALVQHWMATPQNEDELRR